MHPSSILNGASIRPPFPYWFTDPMRICRRCAQHTCTWPSTHDGNLWLSARADVLKCTLGSASTCRDRCTLDVKFATCVHALYPCLICRSMEYATCASAGNGMLDLYMSLTAQLTSWLLGADGGGSPFCKTQSLSLDAAVPWCSHSFTLIAIQGPAPGSRQKVRF